MLLPTPLANEGLLAGSDRLYGYRAHISDLPSTIHALPRTSTTDREPGSARLGGLW